MRLKLILEQVKLIDRFLPNKDKSGHKSSELVVNLEAQCVHETYDWNRYLSPHRYRQQTLLCEPVNSISGDCITLKLGVLKTKNNPLS
jgi:hypothetical protein